MQITKEFLESEIRDLEQEANKAQTFLIQAVQLTQHSHRGLRLHNRLLPHRPHKHTKRLRPRVALLRLV